MVCLCVCEMCRFSLLSIWKVDDLVNEINGSFYFKNALKAHNLYS